MRLRQAKQVPPASHSWWATAPRKNYGARVARELARMNSRQWPDRLFGCGVEYRLSKTGHWSTYHQGAGVHKGAK